MTPIDSFASRLRNAVSASVSGPLGSRRITSLVAALHPLIEEARSADEPWARISAAISSELIRHGRQPIAAGTLRKLHHRLGLRIQRSTSPLDTSRSDTSSKSQRAESSEGRDSPIHRDLDINHRSSSSDPLSSNATAARIKALRRLNNGDT